jgi:hypothetical protein
VVGLLLALPLGAQHPSGPGAPHAPSHALPGGPAAGPIVADLAGYPLAEYPWFDVAKTFFEGAPVEIAVDPSRLPQLVGGTFDVYVTRHRTPSLWATSTLLLDVGGAPRKARFSAGSIERNVLTLDPGLLSGDAGVDFGVGYDIVIDVDGDGELSPHDVIDGLGAEAGFYVVKDPMQPGPLAVTEVNYFVSGPKAGFTGENTFYPTDIADLGQLPVVVISHGNGHNYNWYDHIGNHLASWGFIVMSHRNDTGPGIETASTTTLQHTDAFLANLDTIEGGVLDGHVDSTRIIWIGHSRGGEGIARAYKRITDGDWTPVHYRQADIVGLSSIAPTIFFNAALSNPGGANFHLWTGGADSDVTGCANLKQGQTFRLHERASGDRYSTYLHGAGHGAFHNGSGGLFSNGPCTVGRFATHQIMKEQLLALAKMFTEGNVPATDLMWRPYPRLKPPSASSNACVVVSTTYQKRSAHRFVLDDFDQNFTSDTSSAGGRVTWNVDHISEAPEGDTNNNFTHDATDPMNGMTLHGTTGNVRGAVLGWTARGLWAEWEVPTGRRDLRAFEYLSFRATQVTRHPETLAELGDLSFRVGLRDEHGNWKSIRIGAYGAGIEEPYARGGCGSGTGWANFFETVRIRLSDYLTDGRVVDLSRIEAVRFVFGGPGDSPVGRIGLDDLEFTNE